MRVSPGEDPLTYRHVALMGKARSGKDTVAAHLVRKYAFTRLAFADPLKTAALELDPLIPSAPGMSPVRLSALVRDVGWDYAKTHYPEVRRTLQRMGQGVRTLDEDFWVNVTLDRLEAANTWNLPVVITDVRYPNEAEALRNLGVRLVRVLRSGPEAAGMTPEALRHPSETALDSYVPDDFLTNDGSLAQLHARADALVSRR